MAVHNDIVVLDVNDTFVALPVKVEAMFNWVATHHPSDYVAKVDDDTYVNLEELLSEIDPLPRQLLYYGSMRAGPVVRTKGHRNAEPWLPAAMTSFAPYAGGTGYVLSWDLVQVVAFPRLPHLRMLNEVSACVLLGKMCCDTEQQGGWGCRMRTLGSSCSLTTFIGTTRIKSFRTVFLIVSRPPI